MCGVKCESVVHVLWECSAYEVYSRAFRMKLEELLRCACFNC